MPLSTRYSPYGPRKHYVTAGAIYHSRHLLPLKDVTLRTRFMTAILRLEMASEYQPNVPVRFNLVLKALRADDHLTEESFLRDMETMVANVGYPGIVVDLAQVSDDFKHLLGLYGYVPSASNPTRVVKSMF